MTPLTITRSARHNQTAGCARNALLFCLILLGALPRAGQAQTSFPTSPPPDLPARPLVLPKTVTRTLPNGLKIVVAESHRAPLVTMTLAIPSGSALDLPDSPGLAAAVANQLTAGTDIFTSFELKSAAERLGGSIGAAAGADYTTVSASGLASNATLLSRLLTDVVLHPTFPQSELKIYQQLTLQNLVLQRQDPNFLATQQFNRALYGAHPYANVSTTPEAVQALTPERIKAFYSTHFVPRGAVLIVVGDVKPGALFRTLEMELGGWEPKQGESAAPVYPPFPEHTQRTITLVSRPGSVQSNILLGNLTFRRDDPDFFPLVVANYILGGSGQRLFSSVREREGYAYAVSSSALYDALIGSFTEVAQTRTAVTVPALKLMLDETETIRKQPVSEADLKAAKGYLTGAFALNLTSQAGLAASLLTMEIYHLPADYLATFRAKINAVTAADIQRAAQRSLRPDAAVIVVVGDADKLRDSLKEIGTVEEVDPR